MTQINKQEFEIHKLQEEHNSSKLKKKIEDNRFILSTDYTLIQPYFAIRHDGKILGILDDVFLDENMLSETLSIVENFNERKRKIHAKI